YTVRHISSRDGDAFFFFFQAEDGIRDRNVTGVQTCALPIYLEGPAAGAVGIAHPVEPDDATAAGQVRTGHEAHQLVELRIGMLRSEERRVGKECRDQWGGANGGKDKKTRVE